MASKNQKMATEEQEELIPVVNLSNEFEEEDVSLAEKEIFPGGPTYNDLEEWKSLYKQEVYMTDFDEDNVFIWRPLKRKEYKDIAKVQNADQFYKEERICEKAVLFPKNYSHMHMGVGKAGIPTILSDVILEKSGFVPKTGAMRLS